MRLRSVTYMAVALLMVMTGCKDSKLKPKDQKWTVTLEHTDKGPYGTYLAYESLKEYFAGAHTDALSRGYKYSNLEDDTKYSEGRSLIIMEGLYFYVTSDEWNEIKRFARRGNEVVIFCSWLDKRVEDDLNCYKTGSGEEINKYYTDSTDFKNENVLRLTDQPGATYGYQGRSITGWFSFRDDSDYANDHKKDTTIIETRTITADNEPRPQPDTLGYALNHVNMVRYAIDEGHITIHAAPLTLSNYFLLQKGNEQYLTGLWQTLPTNIKRVYWNDFYRRDTTPSSMAILWRHPATRLALILAIAVLIIYILFESKRKQRIIPIVPPLKNDSVSFVETVGRLYYNKGNHTNLAEKMVQQFLEWVRSHYFLNTNMLNEQFIHQLTIKSGQTESTVRGLMDMIHELRLNNINPDDAYLYQLYTTIQKFYKNK